MKIKYGKLRQILERAQFDILLEDDSAAHNTGTSGDSIDKQIDRYLTKFENSAKQDDVSASQMEALDWNDLIRGHIITEESQDEDQDDPFATDEEQPEDAGDAAGISDDDEPQKLSIDKLDVADFANSVVRLIENFDNMLEIRNTLIRRAKSFLAKAYEEDVVEAFETTLRDDHGMVAGESEGEVQADRYPAPHADRSEGSAAPGAGGGGGM